MSRFFVSNLMILCLLVLIACGHKPAEQKPVYKTVLPEKMNSQFALFLEDYLTSGHNKIRSYDNYSIHARRSNPNLEEMEQVTYFEVHKADIEKAYEQLKRSDTPSKTFYSLLRNTNWITEPDTKKAHLPIIYSEKKNTLTVRTVKGERQFTAKFLETINDFLEGIHFRLIAANKEDLLLQIEDTRDGKYPLLFAKQDFSETMIVKNERFDLEKAYTAGKLDRYKSLLEQFGSEAAFERVIGTRVVFDKEKKKPINVKASDELSEDGAQVYVNGALRRGPEQKGLQKIVDIDSYVKDADARGKEFNIDEKMIAKAAGIEVKNPNLHSVKVEYFTKDFVVLKLQFNKFISMTGDTNVILDLSGDEPEMYVINLDYR